MLTASASCAYSAHAFLPQVPSPLSPRSANIYGSSYRNRMTDANPAKLVFDNNWKAPSQPFSQRPIKKAPGPKSDELRDRRRNAFLRNVQDRRDDNRAEVRAEDIMRLDFLRQERAWEAQEASMAAQLAPDFTEDNWDYQTEPPTSDEFSMQLSQQEEAEQVWQDERAELEAMIASMPSGENTEMDTEHFGSDDEEYDAVFTELLEIERNPHGNQFWGQSPTCDAAQAASDQDMDMS